VKFWDTSALVTLVVDEPGTSAMRRLVKEDPDIVVWMLTSVELLSVLGRLGRATSELADLLPGTRVEAMDLFAEWAVVAHVEGVRRRAERLVGVHPLPAADALQLGAALLASGDRPETLPIVTLDQVLARAARLEGFRVIGDGAAPVRSTSRS
jgi:predicted nucleic acid-binding protein